MERVLLGLGSNLGDRLANLRSAVRGLAALIQVEASSPVYETAPMYDADQGPYLNMAVLGVTGLEPRPLLDGLKALERDLGRIRSRRYGPRRIDLDIVFLGDRIIREPGLEIPHPRLAERAFVLAPAADIAAAWRHPQSGLTVAEHLAALEPVTDVWRHAPESLAAAESDRGR
jgi:2-amino-4-hydroxy-6-hydroxymethyldihydropteridine diphosphokinase